MSTVPTQESHVHLDRMKLISPAVKEDKKSDLWMHPDRAKRLRRPVDDLENKDKRPCVGSVPMVGKDSKGQVASLVMEQVTWGSAANNEIKSFWSMLLAEFPVLTKPVGLPPLVRTEARIALRDDLPVHPRIG